MKKIFAALLLPPIAALSGGSALAQDEPSARLAGRAATLPPLSSRAMPAAPTIHRLSIGPLSNGHLWNAPLEAPAAKDAFADAPATAVPNGGAPNSAAAATPETDNGTEALVQRAKLGEPEANYRLGLKYLAGEGVTRDLVEAFARIRLAAEAGHPRAISLFYTLGAKLTADEHDQAYDRSRQLRQAKH